MQCNIGTLDRAMCLRHNMKGCACGTGMIDAARVVSVAKELCAFGTVLMNLKNTFEMEIFVVFPKGEYLWKDLCR